VLVKERITHTVFLFIRSLFSVSYVGKWQVNNCSITSPERERERNKIKGPALDERLEQSNAASVCPQTDSATTTTTTTISVPNWRPPYSIPLHSSPHQIPSLPSLSIPCTAPTHNAATCEPRQRIRQVHQPLVFSLFYKKYLLNYLGLVPLYIYMELVVQLHDSVRRRDRHIPCGGDGTSVPRPHFS
jgi:hypothetical protein